MRMINAEAATARCGERAPGRPHVCKRLDAAAHGAGRPARGRGGDGAFRHAYRGCGPRARHRATVRSPCRCRRWRVVNVPRVASAPADHAPSLGNPHCAFSWTPPRTTCWPRWRAAGAHTLFPKAHERGFVQGSPPELASASGSAAWAKRARRERRRQRGRAAILTPRAITVTGLRRRRAGSGGDGAGKVRQIARSAVVRGDWLTLPRKRCGRPARRLGLSSPTRSETLYREANSACSVLGRSRRRAAGPGRRQQSKDRAPAGREGVDHHVEIARQAVGRRSFQERPLFGQDGEATRLGGGAAHRHLPPVTGPPPDEGDGSRRSHGDDERDEDRVRGRVPAEVLPPPSPSRLTAARPSTWPGLANTGAVGQPSQLRARSWPSVSVTNVPWCAEGPSASARGREPANPPPALGCGGFRRMVYPRWGRGISPGRLGAALSSAARGADGLTAEAARWGRRLRRITRRVVLRHAIARVLHRAPVPSPRSGRTSRAFLSPARALCWVASISRVGASRPARPDQQGRGTATASPHSAGRARHAGRPGRGVGTTAGTRRPAASRSPD